MSLRKNQSTSSLSLLSVFFYFYSVFQSIFFLVLKSSASTCLIKYHNCLSYFEVLAEATYLSLLNSLICQSKKYIQVDFRLIDLQKLTLIL